MKVVKPDGVHKSEPHRRHHHKLTQEVPVLTPSMLSYTEYKMDEEKDFQYPHRRKRPRSKNSVSEAGEKHPHTRPVRPSSSGIRGRRPSPRSELSGGSRDTALPTICVVAREENPGKKYEKRPRHKTRPDKYELKVDKKVAEKTSHERTHRRLKRKHRKKTALALNHEFKAPNVPQERLTLVPHTGPGIFNRGKASAPVERRGLPDLTFSEMNFLARRSDVEDARHHGSEEVQPRKKSNKSSAEAISAFFSGRKEHSRALQDPQAQPYRQREGPLKQSISPRNSSPARPSVRKPLSITSNNLAPTRAFSTNGLGTAPLSKVWVPDHHAPIVQTYYSAQKESSVQRKHSNSTRSYYSWSARPSQKIPSPADLHGHSEGPEFLARRSNYERRPPSPRKRDVLEVVKLPSDQSSITNRSLDHYTKHVLLEEDKQGVWDRIPRAAGVGGHYTLQDLKRLARLSELDDESGRSAVQFDQPRDVEGRGRVHVPLTSLDEHKHRLLAYTSKHEGVEASAKRLPASIQRKPNHQQKGDESVIEATADSAAPRNQVAQSGRQGGTPADHQSLRDSLPRGNLVFSPDSVVRLLSTNPPSADVRSGKPVGGNVELTRNSPQSPIGRTHNYLHRLRPRHEPAEPPLALGYSEPSLTAEVRFSEAVGQAEPAGKPEPFQAGHEDVYPVECEMLDDNHNKVLYNAVWDGQDDFDRALLQESCSKTPFDPSANMLDDFDCARTNHSFADLGTAPPRTEESLGFGRELEETWLDQRISNIVARPVHAEEFAAGGFAANGLVRSRSLGPNFPPKNGCQLEEEQFMGFARPHILY